MPPPLRPCGRTAEAREVQQLGVAGDEAPAPPRRWPARPTPTTSSPSASRTTSQASRAEQLGVDPLHHALARCRAPGPDRPGRQRGQRPSTRSSPSSCRKVLERRAALQVRGAGGRREGGQVEHVEAQQPSRGGDDADLAPGRGADGGDEDVVRRAVPDRARGLVVCVRASSPAEERKTKQGSSVTSSGTAAAVGWPADCSRTVRRGRAVGLGDLGQLVGDHARAAWPRRRGSRRAPRCAARSSAFSFSSSMRENCVSRRSCMSRMYVAWGSVEVEDAHQARLGLRGVVAGADQLDDLVDVEDRDQQALDEVQPLGGLGAPELRAPAYDVEAVLEEDLEQLLEPERAGLAVDQRDVVDAEGLLHRRQPVELLQDRLGVEAVLDLDHEPQPVLAVGEVLDVGDALQLLGLHERLDLLDHPLRADAVGQLGDDDALAARGDVLDPRGGPHRNEPRPVS